jgi:hypothetical protein
MEEKEITEDEYLTSKDVVEKYESQFWNRHEKMMTELDSYFASHLVCGQRIKKYETLINTFHTVFVYPTEPLFTKDNFIAPNEDKKAMRDVRNIGNKYGGWGLQLACKS